MRTDPLLCPLFVPGNRPDRFDKAFAAGADAVCLDLEAAVGPDEKPAARQAVLEWLAANSGEGCIVRINPTDTDDGRADIEALAGAAARPAWVIVAHSRTADEMNEVAAGLSDACPLIGLIESVEGLQQAGAIATCPAVGALMLGGADLTSQLRCKMNFQSLLLPRSQLVQAAAPADIQLIDVPWLDIADQEGLADETDAVRDLGFTGKAAIHPAQVQTIRRSFRPSAEEVGHAGRVLQAFEQAGGGVVQVDGRMVDAPVVRAMERVLAREALFDGPPTEGT